ncbi:MAG TPA: hypothetical protein VEG42_04135, partial [Thermoplasmata archaeon]|nr:hypothetical protein [Thermoplasmata archaeon]
MTESTPGTSFRWRPLAPLLLVAGVVLLLVGVLSRNPVPLFLALPLLLAPVGAGVVGPRGIPKVEVRFTAEGTGPVVRLEGSLTAPPEVDVRDLVVDVVRPPSLTGDAKARFEWKGPVARFRADWVAPDPTITELPLPRVVWRDPTGLVERPAMVSGSPLV